jgi:hypothetical protein
MRLITKIDIEKSVLSQKLIFMEEWEDKLDRFYIYLIFSILIVCSMQIINETNFNTPNDKFFSIIIVPLIILLAVYVIYRKATEKSLFKMETPFNRQKNRQALLNYADAEQLEIYRKSNDCLILNKSMGNAQYKKSMVFIIKDNLVLYTIIKDHYKLNFPTLISHHILRYELRKLFRSDHIPSL